MFDANNPRHLLDGVFGCYPDASEEELLVLFKAEIADNDTCVSAIIEDWFKQVNAKYDIARDPERRHYS